MPQIQSSADYIHPVVWYWRDGGLYFKQGEAVIGPVPALHVLLVDVAKNLPRRSKEE